MSMSKIYYRNIVRLTFFFVIFTLSFSVQVVAFEFFSDSDHQYEIEDYEGSRDTLLLALKQTDSKDVIAAINWRLARAQVMIGGRLAEGEIEKEILLLEYQKGVNYADVAIRYDPGIAEGYFWKSANLGRIGQVKGIFESLGKASEMRSLLSEAIQREPDYAPAYHVLGMLYEQVPGFPFSFGNIDSAVSFARKAVLLKEREFEQGEDDQMSLNYYTELAVSLNKRNWNSEQRQREQPRKLRLFNREKDPLKRASFYEGQVLVEKISDREEAALLVGMVIESFYKRGSLSRDEQTDLSDAKELEKKLN